MYTRGTHRVLPPERTWARIAPLTSRFGITRVADVTGLDHIGIPVFQAIRPGATTVSVSQGKGLTPMAARVSATMEAIELWHAERLTGTGEEVRDLPYRLADLDLATGSAVREGMPLRWLPGTGLLTGAPIPVPLDLVRVDHTYRTEGRPPLFRATSNGLASGNTLAEATAHALAELCERDSLARLRRTPRSAWRRLDLDSVDDADCRALLKTYAEAGVEVDVVVVAAHPACFEARIRSEALPVTFTGAGCHLDPAIALCRALTEAAQSRLTAIAGARDDLPPVLYRHTTGGGREDLGAAVPWDGRSGSAGLEADIDLLARHIAARTGHEPIRVTLPSPTGIDVVKVVAPGLAFDPRTNVSAGRAA